MLGTTSELASGDWDHQVLEHIQGRWSLPTVAVVDEKNIFIPLGMLFILVMTCSTDLLKCSLIICPDQRTLLKLVLAKLNYISIMALGIAKPVTSPGQVKN